MHYVNMSLKRFRAKQPNRKHRPQTKPTTNKTDIDQSQSGNKKDKQHNKNRALRVFCVVLCVLCFACWFGWVLDVKSGLYGNVLEFDVSSALLTFVAFSLL